MTAQQADDPLTEDYVPPHPDATRPEPVIELVQAEIDERAQRHADATRDEPPEGQSREQWMKSRLKTYFRDPVIYQLVSREETMTGRGLSRFFTDLLDVKTIFALGHLTDMQRRILLLHYGPDELNIQEVAHQVNMHRSTVYRQRHDALEYLIRVYYDEPEYHLPWRVETRYAARDVIADHLRDLGV